MNLWLLPCEVLKGSLKLTARHQLLGRLHQVRAWLPFQHSVLELGPAKSPSISESSKKMCFGSPKHIRTWRDDWILELYRSRQWGLCCFMWTCTFSWKTVLIYKALQFINSADENTVGEQGMGLNIQLVMSISNIIMVFWCFNLCFSFGVLLAMHLVDWVLYIYFLFLLLGCFFF